MSFRDSTLHGCCVSSNLQLCASHLAPTFCRKYKVRTRGWPLGAWLWHTFLKKAIWLKIRKESHENKYMQNVITYECVYIFFTKIWWRGYKVSEGLIICTKVNKWTSESSAVTHSQKVLVPHAVTCKFYMLLSRKQWAWTWSSILSARYSIVFTKRVNDDFIWPPVDNHYVWVAKVPRVLYIYIYIYIYIFVCVFMCMCIKHPLGNATALIFWMGCFIGSSQEPVQTVHDEIPGTHIYSDTANQFSSHLISLFIVNNLSVNWLRWAVMKR